MHMRSYFLMILFILILSTGCNQTLENGGPVDPDQSHPFSLNITFTEFKEKLDETWIWEEDLVFPKITTEENTYFVHLTDNAYLEMIRFTDNRVYLDYCKLIWTETNSDETHEDIIKSVIWAIQLFSADNIDYEDSFFLDSVGITDYRILDENFQGGYYTPPYDYSITRNENGHYLELHINTAAVE